MKKAGILLLLFTFNLSCISQKKTIEKNDFTKVTIDTLFTSNFSCRSVLIDNDKVWFASNNGNFGYLSLNNSNRFISKIKKGDLNIEFRSIAQTKQNLFVLSIANPALLYKINKKTLEYKLVYEEQHEKVFYDAMQFLNDKEGYAIGDPVENCPSLIFTKDGGETWHKVSCTNLPSFDEGEAFFAASNTNLIVKEGVIWMVSGGKKSKVYRSINKGKSWEAFETPLVQGQAMTGAFTADFFDKNNGIIAGGDYEKLTSNSLNKAVTSDGGKTWQLINDNDGFGHASCVQYFPNTDAKNMVSVGATGLFYFSEKKQHWTRLSIESDFYTIRFINDKTAVAAGKNKIVKITFE
jgi:photosystem II stability/assembly factor-like uncharacterized protein